MHSRTLAVSIWPTQAGRHTPWTEAPRQKCWWIWPDLECPHATHWVRRGSNTVAPRYGPIRRASRGRKRPNTAHDIHYSGPSDRHHQLLPALRYLLWSYRQFEEDLDIIYELMAKYSKSQVLILGHLNEDHHNRHKARERLMKNLVRDLALQDIGSDRASKHTYINQNLRQASHIDHILLSCWSSKTILDPDCPENASNTSPHLPVTVSLIVSRNNLNRMKRKTRVSQIVQYQWKEANKGKFSETMVKELEQYKMELLSPEDGVPVFMHAIETATMDVVPAVTRKIGRKKGNPKWLLELSAAVKHSKKMHYLWKQAGGPVGNHPTRIARKKANREVRRVQRIQDAINRNTLLAVISAASENDQRLFHKLVRKQRA